MYFMEDQVVLKSFLFLNCIGGNLYLSILANGHSYMEESSILITTRLLMFCSVCRAISLRQEFLTFSVLWLPSEAYGFLSMCKIYKTCECKINYTGQQRNSLI